MIDLPPKPAIWLPSAPAILRPADGLVTDRAELAGMMAVIAARRRAAGGIASSLGPTGIDGNLASHSGHVFKVVTPAVDGSFSSLTIRMSGGFGGTEDTKIDALYAGIRDPGGAEDYTAVSLLQAQVASSNTWTVTQDITDDKTSDSATLSGVSGDRLIVSFYLGTGTADSVGTKSGGGAVGWNSWKKVSTDASIADDTGFGQTSLGNDFACLVEGIDFA